VSVALDIVGAKVIESNDLTLRARTRYHDGGASRAAAKVEKLLITQRTFRISRNSV
jgi:hypothetical protein